MPYARGFATITKPSSFSMPAHRSSRRPLPPPSPGLFADVVLDPEREPAPDALPIVAVRDEDEPEFLREVERRERRRIRLRRRGVEHGTLSALDPGGLVGPRPRRRRREVIAEQRWRAAQPIFLPGAAAAPRGLEERARRLHGRLLAGELAAWLRESGVALADDDAPCFDAERDLARCVFDARHGDGQWAKLGRLSTHPDDRSLRLRFSFGAEEADDASRDEARHHETTKLARRLLPGADALFAPREDGNALERASRCAGIPLYPTQGIGYWNAPNGGARFHHDAFDEDAVGGQRGVLYWQATGRTLWLALSIEDLGARVREMIGWLTGGELEWVRADVAPTDADLARLVEVTARRDVLLHELALPGCGVLGPLVDRGPEFTELCADAGHAILLEPGDALLLPNHGLDRTAMHSVFHAGGPVAYGLSWALREDLR